MLFIDALLERGGDYLIKRIDGGASLEPASDRESDLKSFQNLVRRVGEHEGDGFRIQTEHVSSEQLGELVGLLILVNA